MIERTWTVKVGPEKAFRAWTELIHLWWPPSHTRHRGRIVLDQRRFVECSPQGEHELGRVVEWAPPERLVYDFYMGSSAEQPTRVFVRFAAIPTGTRIDIEHVPHRLPLEVFEQTAPGYRSAWPEIESSITRYLETSS